MKSPPSRPRDCVTSTFRHRTGVMGAVYRFNYDHWSLEQALAEMDQYEFGSGYGHGKQRDFVKDYWDQFQAKTVAATANH